MSCPQNTGDCEKCQYGLSLIMEDFQLHLNIPEDGQCNKSVAPQLRRPRVSGKLCTNSIIYPESQNLLARMGGGGVTNVHAALKIKGNHHLSTPKN